MMVDINKIGDMDKVLYNGQMEENGKEHLKMENNMEEQYYIIKNRINPNQGLDIGIMVNSSIGK